MTTPLWTPPVEPTETEKRILARCKKSKLFVFLREHRQELFDEPFQRELAASYSDRKGGKETVPPALLALANGTRHARGGRPALLARLAREFSCSAHRARPRSPPARTHHRIGEEDP